MRKSSMNHPHAINPLAPWSDTVRERLENGERLLTLLNIRFDRSLGTFRPGKGVRRFTGFNRMTFVRATAPQPGKPARTGHMRVAKTPLERALELLPQALLGSGSRLHCSEKWAAVFRTPTDSARLGPMALPLLLIADPGADPDLVILRYLMEVAELPASWDDGQGTSLLMAAAAHGNLQAAKLLVDCGAQPDAVLAGPDGTAQSAYSLAQQTADMEMRTYLGAWVARKTLASAGGFAPQR